MSSGFGRLTAVAVCLVVASAGCGGDDAGDAEDRELTVLAASSLTEVFDALAEQLEAEQPGVRVSLVYDSSATLATQVQEGAPGDVLATADLETMQQVVDSGDAEAFSVFATNKLVLVTPRDNPAGVTSVADLSDPEVTFVACVETAPCGKLAQQLLTESDVSGEPRSREVDVKAVLTKVTSGEADAGLVYATDAVAAGDQVEEIEIPGSGRHLTSYAVAVLPSGEAGAAAESWVELLLSPAGQQVLVDAGFGPASREDP